MYNLQEEGRGQLYVPHSYEPYRGLAIAIRTTGDPTSLTAAVRRAIHGVDPNQPIADVSTMRLAVRDSLAQRRLVLTLVGGFAAAALLLVALGIYGVSETVAVTWAVGFHLLSFIPITLIGAYYFARAGLTFAELSKAASSGGSEPSPGAEARKVRPSAKPPAA